MSIKQSIRYCVLKDNPEWIFLPCKAIGWIPGGIADFSETLNVFVLERKTVHLNMGSYCTKMEQLPKTTKSMHDESANAQCCRQQKPRFQIRAKKLAFNHHSRSTWFLKHQAENYTGIVFATENNINPAV